jgi:hypothetical protein
MPPAEPIFVRPESDKRSIFNGVVKWKRNLGNSKNERDGEGAEVAHGLPGELALWDWLRQRRLKSSLRNLR